MTTTSITTVSEFTVVPTGFTDIDILLGKNKICFNHVGNRRFREIIGGSLDDYQSIDSRKNKSQIVNNLIASIYASGSRFLKFNKEKDSWVEIPKGHKIIKEKVGHALRDTLNYKPKGTGVSRATELRSLKEQKKLSHSKAAIKKVSQTTTTQPNRRAFNNNNAMPTSPNAVGSSTNLSITTSDNKIIKPTTTVTTTRMISPSNSVTNLNAALKKKDTAKPTTTLSSAAPIHVIPDIPSSIFKAPTTTTSLNDFAATVSDGEDSFGEDTLSLLEILAKEEEDPLPSFTSSSKKLRASFTNCFDLTPLSTKSMKSLKDIPLPPLVRCTSALDELHHIQTNEEEEKIDFHLDMIEDNLSEFVDIKEDLMKLEMPSLNIGKNGDAWVDYLEGF